MNLHQPVHAANQDTPPWLPGSLLILTTSISRRIQKLHHTLSNIRLNLLKLWQPSKKRRQEPLRPSGRRRWCRPWRRRHACRRSSFPLDTQGGRPAVADWDPVTCPLHVTGEQFGALRPSFDRRIKNQRPDDMNSRWLQCCPQCTATVHRLKSGFCAYATVYCYSTLIQYFDLGCPFSI
jgi:hypothetical protein